MNPDLFDAYFRRADTDRDGRISGQEAVTFFQGANLNREVLAKIWQYSDQQQTGYLSRDQFYNALKLVTVAQTGRELNPAIVSRALNGPAASQIPPPQIQFSPGSVFAAPQAQPQGVQPPFRPMGPSYQQPPVPNPPPGPRPMTHTSLSKPTDPAAPGLPSSISTDWPTNKSSSWPGPVSDNNFNGQIPQAQVSTAALGGSNGSFSAGANSTSSKTQASTEPNLFGGDMFTAAPQKPSVASSQASPNLAAPQMPRPMSSPNQVLPPRQMQTGVQTDRSLAPSSFMASTPSKMLQPVATPAGQQDRGFGGQAPVIDATKTWPKMTDTTVRRYIKIFFEVDTDKDGKLSGNQARDLFLSWHLPREVLKQIWDLSDQDNDSMLSLREFCLALYLMERHREGRTLPPAIPSTFNFDESGVQALSIAEAQMAVAQNSAGYNLPAWQQNPSVLQTRGPGLPPRPVSQGVGLPGQSLMRPVGRDGFVSAQQKLQQRTKAPANQLASRQNTHQEAVNADKKVSELEKQIMDSKEKMEFYRAKMQDIVLFRTRCDNRMAEISDKAAADKREVESLAKRYDEKYKQTAEVQSHLLRDEAAFRDIEDRRLELHNALVRMEQGGDLNAFLQVRADRLQNDLDGLKKVLNTKCKQIGLPVKPVSLLELPFGWQPGIQENAAQWEENWDTFEDEGFAYVQDFMEEGTTGSGTSKPKSVASWDEHERLEDGHDPSFSSDVEHVEATVLDQNHNKEHQDNTLGKKENDNASSSNAGHTGSPSTSPKVAANDSQKLELKPTSPRPQFDDFASNGGEWASVFNHKGDESFWGRSDSVSEDSGFPRGQFSSATSFSLQDPSETLSISGHEKNDLPSFGPIRTKERTSVFFDNSVPSTPLTSYSPGRVSSGGFFDNSVPSTPLTSYSSGPVSSRGFFDDSVPSTPLYNNHATVSGLPTREQFTRFDSFSSTSSDFPRTFDNFARFDSFSSGPSSSQGFMAFDEPDVLGSGFLGGSQQAVPR